MSKASDIVNSSAVKAAFPYIVGIGAAAGVTYLGYRFLKNTFTSEEDREQRDDIEDVDNTNTQDQTTRPNISAAEAASIAKTQKVAMEGFGTDEEALFSSLEGLNGKALQMVFEKFGLYPTDGWGGWLPTWLGGTNFDLFGWYRMELNEEELERMNQIWAKSGLRPSRSSGMGGPQKQIAQQLL